MSASRETQMVGVVGGSGFVGSAIIRRLGFEGVPSRVIRAPRLSGAVGSDPAETAQSWAAANPEVYGRLMETMTGVDVIVNAAGMPSPAAGRSHGLWAANVVMPLVLASACVNTGVRRLVHVSTAAVQGRKDPLDESLTHVPFSPYSATKAEAESHLLDWREAIEIVLYRPTSVIGRGRRVTERLVGLGRRRRVPIVGDGHQSLPVCLLENVAAAAVLLASHSGRGPLVALQPEHETVSDLVRIFAPKAELASIPSRIGESGAAGLRVASRVSPRLAALTRQAELLARGQRIAASSLERLGYRPVVSHEEWAASLSLAEGVRP